MCVLVVLHFRSMAISADVSADEEHAANGSVQWASVGDVANFDWTKKLTVPEIQISRLTNRRSLNKT